MAFVNACWFVAGSSGTSDFADGTALTGYFNLDDAGAVNAAVYSYRAYDPTDPSVWEIGRGAYSSGGNTLARSSVIASSTGSKIDFAVAPIVAIVPVKEDLDEFAPKASPTFTGTVTVPDGSFTPAKLNDGAAVSVLARSANSSGARADLAAGSNDTVLARTSNALSFTAITFAMLASAALATASDYHSATASKLLTADGVWGSNGVLTDGETITVDFATGLDFGGSSNAVLALGGNRTLGSPSNVKNGQKGVLWFGAASSTRTLTLHADWLLMDGVEVGPYSITTSQILGVAYVVRGSAVYVTGILRRAA